MQTKTSILSAWIYGNAHTTFCSSLLPTAMVVALNSSNSARQPFQQRWKLFRQQLQWWQPFQQRGGSSTTNLPTRDDSDSIPPLPPPMPPLKDLAMFASPRPMTRIRVMGTLRVCFERSSLLPTIYALNHIHWTHQKLSAQ